MNMQWVSPRVLIQKNHTQERNNTMKRPPSHLEQAPVSTAFIFQRISLAACIILAPLSITLYLVSWAGNLREPLIDSSMAGPTGNTLHFIGGIAASFFLPLGYLGMSLLGMRRAPWLATISAVLSLVGWIPWAALISLDDLAYTIDSGGSPAHLVPPLKHFNRGPRIAALLLIVNLGHLLS